MTESIYKDEFLFHYKNQTRNKTLKIKSHVGKDINTSCGDEITIELNVQDGVIHDVGYNSNGCIISTGATSILCDHLIGKSLIEAESLKEDAFIELLGIDLTFARRKCALVGYKALKGALGK